MGTGEVSQRPGRRPRLLAAAVVGVALVAAVVLSRGGTAATSDDLDGVADPRLGARPALTGDRNGTGEWFHVGLSDDGRCTMLRPVSAPAGLGVVVWQVDGVVAAVAMTAPGAATPARTSFGIDFGDDLAAAAVLPGAVRSTEDVPGAAVGPVSWVVVPVDDVEVLASDLGGDVGVLHLEVRTPAGNDCRSTAPWEGDPDLPLPSTGTPQPVQEDGSAAPVPVVDLPVLDAVGRGPFRYGQPAAELPGLGLREHGGFQATSGCDLWFPETNPPGTEGLGGVWTRDDQVVGIGVERGTLAEGLAVGDDVEQLLAAFPDLAVEAVDGPLLPPFPTTLDDGRSIDVQVVDTYVVPGSVDALLVTDRRLVTSVTVWSSPCDA